MRIVTILPDTGYEQPTDDELRRLLTIVVAGHPWIGEPRAAEFKRAFYATGFQWRLHAPDRSRAFFSVVDSLNDFLEGRGMPAVEGDAAFAAIIAAGDICWRAPNSKIGQLLEIGLSRYSGLPCRNAWRDVLSGKATLLAPVPPSTTGRDNLGRPVPEVAFFREDRGQMRPMLPGETTW